MIGVRIGQTGKRAVGVLCVGLVVHIHFFEREGRAWAYRLAYLGRSDGPGLATRRD